MAGRVAPRPAVALVPAGRRGRRGVGGEGQRVGAREARCRLVGAANGLRRPEG